jgi:hypothetical protein
VHGHLIIAGTPTPNASLTSLEGLNNLVEVGNDLNISAENLPNVDALSHLTAIGGSLGFDGNASLTNLDGLSSLSTIGGDIEIYDNASLTSLDGLSSLSTVGGDIKIFDNENLPYCEICDLLDQLVDFTGDVNWVNHNFIDECWDGSNLDCP